MKRRESPSPMMRSDRGSSMVFTILVLFALVALGAASLSGATSGLQLSNNYRTGTQALEAAESGIIHVVKKMNDLEPTRMDTDIYNVWSSTVWPSATVAMTDNSDVSYTITPTHPDPMRNAPRTNIQVTAVGAAPGQSRRTIVAHLAMTPCGAIDMPSSGLNTTFNGNNFLVDGNDYLMGCTPDPRLGVTCINPAGSPILGISTRAQSDVDEIVSSLRPQQYDNVTGLSGGEPASVGACQSTTTADLQGVFVPRMLAAGGNPPPNPPLRGNDTFGTLESPQVTHFTGDVTINGTVNGAGILIVDGGLTVSGNLNFTGLVIVTGTTQFTNIEGNSTIIGSLWTTSLDLNVNGSASVSYSSQALDLVNSMSGNQNLVPKHVAVVAWSQS